ncbi:hypothetical protein SAMN00768000_1649 [Sulfobacillus thermosulfidooxidans DSM 9293]|uniref:Uncharacterized protein n=1 Tax=Sulfobacillus thermosulfidooxidans (strain DSM 9293 / VKM B-1269 / AT-1) TaxID=929705 RepID=A0A1W1WDR7_SULTA|nr:hypothetical protein [Sulfobacillus thermosulfidooxidans]SMC04427.1 hypothetical protein SAMN00768000_1649 [Sulfobacillus thermosulfidooxidans DSM 9293]
MGSPDYAVSANMAQVIVRLATIRREIRQLETEEHVIRQELLKTLQDWPPNAFPIRVGEVELRLQQRNGRIDYEEALQVLDDHGLLDQAASEAVVSDQEALVALRIAISELSMPQDTQQQLSSVFQKAVQFRPALSAEWLERLFKSQALDEASYARCFKDQKPVVPVLVVR